MPLWLLLIAVAVLTGCALLLCYFLLHPTHHHISDLAPHGEDNSAQPLMEWQANLTDSDHVEFGCHVALQGGMLVVAGKNVIVAFDQTTLSPLYTHNAEEPRSLVVDGQGQVLWLQQDRLHGILQHELGQVWTWKPTGSRVVAITRMEQPAFLVTTQREADAQGTVWRVLYNQEAVLLARGGPFFGTHVAYRDGYMALTDPQEQAVEVWQRQPDCTWNQVSRIRPQLVGMVSCFPYSVALTERWLLLGHPTLNQVVVFRREGAHQFRPTAELHGAPGFGQDLCCSGPLLAVKDRAYITLLDANTLQVWDRLADGSKSIAMDFPHCLLSRPQDGTVGLYAINLPSALSSSEKAPPLPPLPTVLRST